jgi:acetyltransferase-like isoleucine patch superfamily enzyme
MRGANRLRSYQRRGEELVRTLRPTRWTALRTPADQVPPHPSAFASFGSNSWIVPPARVIEPGGMAVGSGVVVLEYSTLAVLDGGRLTIGDGVHLARFVSVICASSVTIEDHVLSSDGVIIGDSWRLPVDPARPGPNVPPPPAEPVHIGRGAYLAFNSVILPGVTVGEGAYVAENAVVAEDVPAHSVAQGNPAQIIRRYDPATETWEGKPWP